MVVAWSRLTGIILFQNIYYTVIESYASVFLHFLFSREDRESFQSVFSSYILFFKFSFCHWIPECFDSSPPFLGGHVENIHNHGTQIIRLTSIWPSE